METVLQTTETTPKVQPKPIVYDTTVEVRFSDYDLYGHVNLKNYFDYLVVSRWQYHLERFGIGIDEYIKKGLGFFISNTNINYKRPILGGQNRIRVRSHITSVDRAKVTARFEILSTQNDVVHCEGTFEFFCVDMKTGRPTNLPEWTLPYFFET